ncbi:MAG: Rieske 2Fe-2S domain-containing protein [Pirellulales bacterium]
MWYPVCRTSECPPGSSREFVAGERIVALYNVDGAYYALDGICPHSGGPLGRGRLTGCVVTCPWHGWQFDVRDGQHQLNALYHQPTFAVRVVGETIEIEISADS